MNTKGIPVKMTTVATTTPTILFPNPVFIPPMSSTVFIIAKMMVRGMLAYMVGSMLA